MTIKEQSSYVKGLLDGCALDTTTPEGKLISALADLCDKLAAEVKSLREDIAEIDEYIEEVDEDLSYVEDLVYDFDDDDDDEDDDDEYDCDGDCDGCCGCEDDEDEDEDEFYCAMCPSCGGKVYFDDNVDPEDVICPACQKPLISEDDEDLD